MTTYRLKDPVQNPQFDRRHKHGIEAIKIFAPGHFFFAHKRTDGPGIRSLGLLVGRRSMHIVDRDLVQALVANAQPEEPAPTSLREILFATDNGHFEIDSAFPILEILLVDKAITPAQVIAAFNQYTESAQ